MRRPAAKQGDQILATDVHIVLVPTPMGRPIPTPLPHPFTGIIQESLSANVNIMGLPAATLFSVADDTPPHLPTPPGTAFVRPPSNKGTIIQGSSTVFINRKPAARDGDTALTCNDPVDLPVGKVVAVGTVLIGG
jgi:uncharacterized Zn-binding protein involved in type VI secretion